MNLNEMRSTVLRSIREGVATWRKVPELIESGRLAKSSGNWYRLKDPRVIREISRIIGSMKADRTGAITHVQIRKPSKKFIAIADRAAARGKTGA